MQPSASEPFPPHPPPWAAWTTTTQTGWPAACRPPVTVPSWLRRCSGCWRFCRRGVEREGGAARRLDGFLAGVRRTKIEAWRYTVGWTRLNVGGRRRRATALVVETRTGSQGRGASLGVKGDSDGWGPDDCTADAPPVTFRKGGVFLPPPSIVADPWTAITRTVRIRSGRVI